MSEETQRVIVAAIAILAFGLSLFNTLHNIRKDHRDRREKDLAKAAERHMEFEYFFEWEPDPEGKTGNLGLSLVHKGRFATFVEPYLVLCGPSFGRDKVLLQFYNAESFPNQFPALFQPGEKRLYNVTIRGDAPISGCDDEDMVEFVVRHMDGEWVHGVLPALKPVFVSIGAARSKDRDSI